MAHASFSSIATVTVVVAIHAGCLKLPSFQCSSDSQCYTNNGVAGVCEGVGYCSFPDARCGGGLRFGDQSGPYANQCVATDAGINGNSDSSDSSDDAPHAQLPTFIAANYGDTGPVTSLAYTIDIPANTTDRFLVVSIHVGADCVSTPPMTDVSYDDLELTLITSITGTPCGPTGTRSELWGLVAPPSGPHLVQITLSDDATMYTLLSGAIAAAGVNQSTPVRAFASASGSGPSAQLTLATAPGDLVVDSIGEGTAGSAADASITTSSIDGPGPQQTLRFLDDLGTTTVPANAAGSTERASASTAIPTWSFIGTGDWQQLACSLQP